MNNYKHFKDNNFKKRKNKKDKLVDASQLVQWKMFMSQRIGQGSIFFSLPKFHPQLLHIWFANYQKEKEASTLYLWV